MKERGDIPEETEVTLVSDQSQYIRKAISNLYSQLGLGAILVAVVIFVFLRRFVPTIVVVALIALATLFGGLGFAFTGQTINVMTLFAMIRSFGWLPRGGAAMPAGRGRRRPPSRRGPP